jgi:hypothetical protein
VCWNRLRLRRACPRPERSSRARSPGRHRDDGASSRNSYRRPCRPPSTPPRSMQRWRGTAHRTEANRRDHDVWTCGSPFRVRAGVTCATGTPTPSTRNPGNFPGRSRGWRDAWRRAASLCRVRHRLERLRRAAACTIARGCCARSVCHRHRGVGQGASGARASCAIDS